MVLKEAYRRAFPQPCSLVSFQGLSEHRGPWQVLTLAVLHFYTALFELTASPGDQGLQKAGAPASRPKPSCRSRDNHCWRSE